MATRNVPAGNGIKWVTEAVQLVLKNPGPFALMGLVVAVASAIPLLGSLALAILGPAMYGSVAYAAREQAQGRKAKFEHIGQAFQQPGKLGPMVTLCLPGVIFGLLFGVLMVIVIAVGAMGAGVSAMMESPGAMVTSLGIGFLLLLVLAIPLALLVFATVFFAIPDVMFAGTDAFDAMRASLRAALANIGALLLFALVVFGASMIAMLVLGVVSSILGQLLVSIAVFPVIAASMYLAWKDVYGEPALDMPVADIPPPRDDAGIVA